MNKPTTEKFRARLKPRIARIHVMSDQDLTDLYAAQMVKLKTIRQWKREGRPGDRPCSYPDTWMITVCTRALKARRLAIPYVTALGIRDECLLCIHGLSHTPEEHDQSCAYTQEIHKRVRASISAEEKPVGETQ